MARPTHANAQLTRSRLLGAATVAFSRKGLEGTTLRVIAQEAGVTMPTIHHYFGSKKGLFDTCRSEALNQLTSELVPLGALMGAIRDEVVAGRQADLSDLVARLVRDGSRAARSHRMALQLVWRPLVENGRLDPLWIATVLEPFLQQVTAALSGPLDRTPTSLRLDVQGVVTLTLRYALSSPAHLAQLAGLPAPMCSKEEAQVVDAIDAHLVDLTQRLLDIRHA